MNRFLTGLLALCACLFCLPFSPSAAVAAEIEIYTASYYGECQRAKAYLRAKGIAFDERDVEKDVLNRSAPPCFQNSDQKLMHRHQGSADFVMRNAF